MHTPNCSPSCYRDAVTILDRVRLREDLPMDAHIDREAAVERWLQRLWESRGYRVGKSGVILATFKGSHRVYTYPAVLMRNLAGES